MSDHDKGLIDRVKDALGMGDDHEDKKHHDPIDVERGAGGDLRREAGDPIGGVDGATQASGRVGATGGTGASGAMGGAGAGGPIGDDPLPSTGETSEGAPVGGVRTEYEMAKEFNPDHERLAESGVMAERRGDAAVDTWRNQGSDTEAASDEPASDAERPERDERA